jgi:outer membrane receptor protein involved in Fe transport
MTRPRNFAIALAAASSLWGARARADGGAVANAVTNAEPTAAPADADVDCTNLSPADCKMVKDSLAGAETVNIYDERPDKPFDRDTATRLTGEQLAARGATDLATALALLPDVTVRDAGRGGFNIDIRGGRKGDVSVLVDGVLVTDPYYGTFDLSSIPITDIVEIRISTTPQSPIDGPGGPGGVIEVHTRDAIGAQLVIARVAGDSLPSTGMSFMARAALAPHLAIRVSATGVAGARDLKLAAPFDRIGEGRRDAGGSARLEYRDGDRRVVADAFVDDRHYVVPPNEMSSSFLLVDRETSTRVSAKGDDKHGGTQVQAQGWVH